MTFAKYYAVGRADIVEKIAYGWNQLFSAVFIATILFVFFHIWTAIYAGKETIAGFSIAQMIWYLALAETITFVSGTEWIEKIGEEVRSGMLATSLLKPMNYVGAKFSIHFANFVYKFVTIGAFSFVVAYLLVGPIVLSWKSILFSAITVCIATMLNFSIVAIIGLMAFWFEDNTAFYWIYQKATFILGGMLVPLDVYPVWLQSWIYYLPFSFMMYMPARLLILFDFKQAIVTIIGQVVWLVLAFIVLSVIYKVGLRKVSIHGG